MSRIGADAVQWQGILAAVKAGAQFRNQRIRMAFGYDDGPVSAWPAEAWAAVQAAGLQAVHITVTGLAGAHVAKAQIADSEPGDLTPAAAALWAQNEIAGGAKFPVIYTDRSQKPQVISDAAARGLHLGRDYGLLVATLDGSLLDLDGSKLRDQPGVVGIQYLPASRTGYPIDITLVTDDAWLPSAAPVPPGWLVAAAASAVQLAKDASDLAGVLQSHGG